MTEPDEYVEIADYRGLFMDEPWDQLPPVIATAFGDLGPDEQAIEVGAARDAKERSAHL